MPTLRARSASSKSIPPGPSDPSSIPSARKATSAGTPAREAPSPTRMLAARTPPTSSRSVPTSMLYLRCSARTRGQPGRAADLVEREEEARGGELGGRVVEHERGAVGRADRPARVAADRAALEDLRLGELVRNLAAAVLES